MTERVSAVIRAFLAVRVAAEIEARLADLKRRLAAIQAAVRWVRDDGLHVTVKFLGAIEPGALDAMRGSLEAELAPFAAFDAEITGLGVFPSLRRPRVVWAGLGAAPAAELAERVQRVAAPFGFPPEARPFHGHITLGRVSAPSGWPRLEAELQAHWSDEFGSCAIAELIAYRSDLRRGGAVYTKLWTIPFVPKLSIEGEGNAT